MAQWIISYRHVSLTTGAKSLHLCEACTSQLSGPFYDWEDPVHHSFNITTTCSILNTDQGKHFRTTSMSFKGGKWNPWKNVPSKHNLGNTKRSVTNTKRSVAVPLYCKVYNVQDDCMGLLQPCPHMPQVTGIFIVMSEHSINELWSRNEDTFE